jgi:hypothetical protein
MNQQRAAVRPVPAAPNPRSCHTSSPSEGAGIFRVERRAPKGGRGSPGDPYLEDVTFKAPMRVLFWKKWARTTVRQAAEWAPGGDAVVVRFDLIQSVRLRRQWRGWGQRDEAALSGGEDVQTVGGGTLLGGGTMSWHGAPLGGDAMSCPPSPPPHSLPRRT